MAFNKVTVHDRAWSKMDTISAEERQQVLSALESLLSLPRTEWGKRDVRQFPNGEELYVLPVGSSLRVLFQPMPGGELEIQDLVRQELLDRYFALSS